MALLRVIVVLSDLGKMITVRFVETGEQNERGRLSRVNSLLSAFLTISSQSMNKY